MAEFASRSSSQERFLLRARLDCRGRQRIVLLLEKSSTPLLDQVTSPADLKELSRDLDSLPDDPLPDESESNGDQE